MEIVFTSNALSTCTRSGKNGARNGKGQLYQGALQAIFKFAETYQIEQTGWRRIDLKEMQRAATKKLDDVGKEYKMNKKKIPEQPEF